MVVASIDCWYVNIGNGSRLHIRTRVFIQKDHVNWPVLVKVFIIIIYKTFLFKNNYLQPYYTYVL